MLSLGDAKILGRRSVYALWSDKGMMMLLSTMLHGLFYLLQTTVFDGYDKGQVQDTRPKPLSKNPCPIQTLGSFSFYCICRKRNSHLLEKKQFQPFHIECQSLDMHMHPQQKLIFVFESTTTQIVSAQTSFIVSSAWAVVSY